jgi:hypothetical protein
LRIAGSTKMVLPISDSSINRIFLTLAGLLRNKSKNLKNNVFEQLEVDDEFVDGSVV